jgi:hypothetical protein
MAEVVTAEGRVLIEAPSSRFRRVRLIGEPKQDTRLAVRWLPETG